MDPSSPTPQGSHSSSHSPAEERRERGGRNGNGSEPSRPGEAATLERLLFEIKKVIVGQDRGIERMLACLVAGGHCLLESVPGLAKTLSVETMATAVGGTFSRVQFTPDLLPADVVGTRIYRASTEKFDVELGPVFANFLLADEINRAPAKVQSALLEVMAEKQVTIGGRTHRVPSPFLVLATQNPIESEGVYPLPEAQRDRFLMKVVLDYPSPAEEVEIVQRMGTEAPRAEQVVDLDQVHRLQQVADQVYVDRSVLEYAVNVVLCTRTPENYGLPELRSYIELGASPRASIGLVRGGRALALLRGRSYLTPQDVFDVAPEILRHRLLLSYEALAQDVDVEQVLNRILSTVPAPRVSPSQPASTADSYHGVSTDARAWGA
jgi:MoxR-like ATPase